MSRKIHRNSLQPGYMLHWYKIEEILGQGGFGITYLAKDSNLDSDVAIKEYLPIELAVRTGDYSVHAISENHDDKYKWGLDRFITEARTLHKFGHPNIVRVLTVFEANNTGYMVMPYEHGESLQQKLKGKGTLEEAELLRILIPILGGLDVIHRAGFIHRDIKPDNIYIRKDGSPVLLDFGSARQALGIETKTLTSLISPGYAPYEQYYSKSDEQGVWTDIYGLGATLYRAVTGISPMDAVDRSKGILQVNRDNFVLVSEIAKDRYSQRFLKAIDHALKFKPEDRPQSISQWRKEFEPDESEIVTLMPAKDRDDPAVAAIPALKKKITAVDAGSRYTRSVESQIKYSDQAKWALGLFIGAILIIVFIGSIGFFGDQSDVLNADSSDTARSNSDESRLKQGTLVEKPYVVSTTNIQHPLPPVESEEPKQVPVVEQTVVDVSTAEPVLPVERPEEIKQAPVVDTTDNEVATTEPQVLPSDKSPEQDVSSTSTSSPSTVEFVELTFYEEDGSVDVTPDPVYITEFPKSKTRYIYYHVTIRNLLYGVRSHTPDILGKYYNSDGTFLGESSAGVLVGSDLDTAYLSNGWGWEDPGYWEPGTYRVDVLIKGVKVAEKQFSIYADDAVSTTQQNKPALEQTTAAGTVEFVELTFYEEDGEVDVTPDPVYVTEFPKSKTRYIYFHVTIRNLLYGIRPQTPDIVGKYYKSDGTYLGESSAAVLVGPDLDLTYLSNGWGWADPGYWETGIYRVDVLVNGAKVAEKKFSVYADY